MPKKTFKPVSPLSVAEDEQKPALHKAAEDGDRAEVKRLLAGGADVSVSDAEGIVPLSYAIAGGNMEVVADMLAAKADANAAPKAGDLPGLTPLHLGVLLDHPDVVGILTGGGADINRQDDNGHAPLHFAAILDRPAVARALIKHGADVNLRGNDEAAPLNLAARKDHYIVADILIENKAKVNLTDMHGDTPLHEAARYGSSNVAERLIEAGADINKKNKAGRTPLYIAQEHGHNKVADILIAANGNFRNMVAPPPEHKSVPAHVYDEAWMSIVAVENPGAGKSGSGVIIAPGVVATNRHVIEDGGDIIVKPAENRLRISESDEYPAEVDDEATSGVRDLCLLKVEGLESPPIKIRTYQTLCIGEDVYAVGNPEGLELSLSVGIISQLRGDGTGERHIQTDAAISRGSSGGGLFDRNGNLVGITTSGIDGDENDAQNLNLAIPADWLLGYFAK